MAATKQRRRATIKVKDSNFGKLITNLFYVANTCCLQNNIIMSFVCLSRINKSKSNVYICEMKNIIKCLATGKLRIEIAVIESNSNHENLTKYQH